MRVRTWLSLVAVAALTLAGTIAIRGWRHAIVSAGVALGGSIVGGELLARLSRARATRVSDFERALGIPTEEPSRPADLASLERIFSWESYTPQEFVHRVRPTLLRLAEGRSPERDLGSIERGEIPEKVARYLLDPLPDRPITTDEIDALVDEIESLS